MPVRRADAPTTLRMHCSAANSLAVSRHQVCLVSDRGTRIAAAAKPVYEFSTGRPARISVTSGGTTSDV